MGREREKAEQQGDVRDYAAKAYLGIKQLADSVDRSADPVVRRALLFIRQFPRDKELIDAQLSQVQQYLARFIAVRQPDPFDPAPVKGSVDGPVRLGVVKGKQDWFGLSLDELNQHVLITGRSGSGKTTLIYLILSHLLHLGVPFWAFDFKQDYRHLVKTGKVLVFDWSRLKFNPLRPPPGVKAHSWMQAFANVFCQTYYLLSGTKKIILEHVYRLYQEYGCYQDGNVFPSMADLAESVNKHKLQRMYGREAGFLESAQNRIGECLISFGEMFDCDQGFPIEELLDRNVVFELEGLVTENQAFFLNMLLRYVFQYRISNNQRGMLKHVFLFDEAKSVYNKKRENTQELGAAEIAQFTTKVREFGEGLIVADQMPTELGESIKANVYTVICLSQSGATNVYEMARAIGLNRDQEAALRELRSEKAAQVFEAVVKLSGRWPKPFVMNIPPLNVVKDVDDAQVETFMQPFLEELGAKVVPRTDYKTLAEARKKAHQEIVKEEKEKQKEQQEEKEQVEGNTLIRILTDIRDHPFTDQKKRIETLSLGTSSSTTTKYFKELVAQGLATTHKVGLGKGQSTITLYELTDKGFEYARMKKTEVPGKGDYKHKFWQHTIKEFFTSLGHTAEVEKRFGMKNVDVGYVTNGKKTAVEVELSSDHLIENVQLDDQAGCDEIIIAVPSKRSMTSYKKKIEFYNKDYLNKVEFRVLTDFLD